MKYYFIIIIIFIKNIIINLGINIILFFTLKICIYLNYDVNKKITSNYYYIYYINLDFRRNYYCCDRLIIFRQFLIIKTNNIFFIKKPI